MYPKRLLLEEARSLGITILGVDVNASTGEYRVERAPVTGHPPDDPDLPDGSGWGIRLSLADVKGMSAGEIARVVAGAPYDSLADFWQRAAVSRPVVERLVLVGAFDSVHGTGAGRAGPGLGSRGRLTRRDLLLHVAELDRWSRAASGRSRGRTRRADAPAPGRGQAGCAAGAHECRHPRRQPADPRPRRLPGARRRRRPARDERPRPGERRAGDPRPGRLTTCHGLLRADAPGARGDPQRRPALGAQRCPDPRCRGQGRDPDATDPLRASGRLPHRRRLDRTGRRDLLRGRAGALCRDDLPLPG
uniref:Uncharacterized protein n=1 Tax=Janibacter limosus TaxID=53458 RepID=A0AC61U8N5_9MICO|nr:hypothetical protein [Janibacter limosus]